MFLRFDCVRVSVVDIHNCLHIVICSVSFNGVKIGWWPHARPGPAFPMLTIYYNLVFVYCPEKRRKKTKQKKTDEHLALSVLDLSDSQCWLNIEQIVLHELMGKLICGQHGAAATTKGIVDGQAILLNELFSSCGFLSFFLSPFQRAGDCIKREWNRVRRSPDGDFWLILTVSVVTMASKVAIVFDSSKQLSPAPFSILFFVLIFYFGCELVVLL